MKLSVITYKANAAGSTAAPPSSNPLQPPNFTPQTEEGAARTSDDNNDGSEVNAGLSRAVCNKSKNSGRRTKSNQRWMKPKPIRKKPPVKREDSFLKSFSTRRIPETQVEDTGSEDTTREHRMTNRQRGQKVQVPRTVVNPENNFYFYWLWLITVCILYNLWMFIALQTYSELQIMYHFFWVVCDGFVNGVFVLDVVVQFRTGYLERGLMVYDSKKLAKHYMASRSFLVDIAAVIPLNLLQHNMAINPIIRFIRSFKVYRAVSCYYMVKSRTAYPNFWRAINHTHILLVLAHWLGCFYFLLSQAEGFQGNWTYPLEQEGYATLTRKYLGSLYWSTSTLTTMGTTPTPETNAEYVFTIVSYHIGVLTFATIVGQVSNIIANKDADRLEFERRLDDAKNFMRHHKVPGHMRRRVRRWYDNAWSRGRIHEGGVIKNTALRLLPDKLKTELALHVYLNVLKKVTIFQECPPEFLHDLVLKMKLYFFTPGDCICRKGEVAQEMFIVADGILEVISETGQVLSTMETGDVFGEIGILNLDGYNKRIADVRSVGYSELFSISRIDVLAALKHYPEAKEILQTLGRKRLQQTRNMARKCAKNSRKQQEYLGEMLLGIKQVIQGQLHEMYGQFQERFHNFEKEIRELGEIISQQQTRIQALKRMIIETSGFENGFMKGASLNTVFSSSRREIKKSGEAVSDQIRLDAKAGTYIREHAEKLKQRKSLDDQNYQESIESQDSTWPISQHMTSENRPSLSREQSGHCTSKQAFHSFDLDNTETNVKKTLSVDTGMHHIGREERNQHGTFGLGSFFGCSRGAMPKPNSNDIVLDIGSDCSRSESTSTSSDSDSEPARPTAALEEFVDTNTKRGRGNSAQGNTSPITGSGNEWEMMMPVEEHEKREREMERDESRSHRYPYRLRDLEEASDTPQREDSPDDLSNSEDTNSTTQLSSQPVGKTNSTGRHRAGSTGEQMRPDSSEPQPGHYN